MKRKDYEKPAVRVVEIQHSGMLMTSDKRTIVEDYEEWDEEDI